MLALVLREGIFKDRWTWAHLLLRKQSNKESLLQSKQQDQIKEAQIIGSTIKNFEIIAELGKGAYSSVYKVRRIQDGQIYAMKKIDFQKSSSKEKDNALNELNILQKVKGNHIIKFHEAFLTDDSHFLCLIMECADAGDLLQLVKKKAETGERFNEDEIWAISIQMILGLKSLHDQRIMHRDLKSANIFIYQNGVVKVGDLNVSKIMRYQMSYNQTGTPYYASPEIWRDKPYDLKSDIWSIGIIIYEMAMLQQPFRAEDIDGLYTKVCRGRYTDIDQDLYSPQLSQFIKSMLTVASAQRPSCDQILAMPFVHSMMVKLGMASLEISPVKQFNLQLKDPQFKPSDLQPLLAPYNQLHLQEKLPKGEYDDNFQQKTYLEQAKDIFPRVTYIRSYPYRQGKDPILPGQDESQVHRLFDKTIEKQPVNIHRTLFNDEQEILFSKISQEKQLIKIFDEKYKQETEKRRQERQKFYESQVQQYEP
eukprot:403339981